MHQCASFRAGERHVDVVLDGRPGHGSGTELVFLRDVDVSRMLAWECDDTPVWSICGMERANVAVEALAAAGAFPGTACLYTP
eukprot:10267785-Lingulodinium_polyedra.AAC.1